MENFVSIRVHSGIGLEVAEESVIMNSSRKVSIRVHSGIGLEETRTRCGLIESVSVSIRVHSGIGLEVPTYWRHCRNRNRRFNPRSQRHRVGRVDTRPNHLGRIQVSIRVHSGIGLEDWALRVPERFATYWFQSAFTAA